MHFNKRKITDTAVYIADYFFKNVFNHHGSLYSIVSNRDRKFRSYFCRNNWNKVVHLKMSTIRYPQTDEAWGIIIRMMENYLICYCSHSEDDWDDLLPGAEFSYGSPVIEDLYLSPFELDLVWTPKPTLNSISGYCDFSLELRKAQDEAKYLFGTCLVIVQDCYSSFGIRDFEEV